MKVLTRTLLVLLAVPLGLAVGARFVSHPSAARAPTVSTTTTTTWNPKPYKSPDTCIKWRHGQCIDSEIIISSGGDVENGDSFTFSSSTPTHKNHH